MKPLRIELENFTSYAKESVNLEGVMLAALVGDNGAGKSSLVDAILWCLFGEASKGRGDGPYLRKVGGQHVYPLRVALEFELGGRRYQVVRVHTKSKVLLDLYEWGEAAQKWEGQSDKKKGDTQEEITKLLRLSYDTLTSSALMLQGKSDTFTGNMTDGKRMETLEAILGLDRYGTLLEAAKARVTRYTTQADGFVTAANNHRQRADTAPVIEQDLADKRLEAGVVARRLGVAENVVAELNAALAQRPALLQQQQDLTAAKQRAERDHTTASDEYVRLGDEIRTAEVVLTKPDRILAEIPGAEAHLAERTEDREKHSATVDRLVAEAADFTTAGPKLEEARQEVAQRRPERPKRAQRMMDMQAELRKAQALLRQADNIREAAETTGAVEADAERWAGLLVRLTEAERNLHKLQIDHGVWESDRRAKLALYMRAVEDCTERAGLLDQVPCGADLQPKCPLLQDALGATAKGAATQAKLTVLQQETNPYMADRDAAISALTAIGYDEEAHHNTTARLRELKPLADKVPALEAAEQRVRELTADMERLGVEDKADGERILHLEREVIPDLERKVAEQHALQVRLETAKRVRFEAQTGEGMAQSRLAALRADLRNAEAAAADAQKRLPGLRKRQSDADVAIEIANVERKQAVERLGAVAVELLALQNRAAEAQHAQQAVEQERRLLAEVNTAQGTLQARLEEAQRAREYAIDLERQARAVLMEAQAYQVLVEAYGGKRGTASVQKLIVEAAVPQIERLCNDFLGNLAAGRLQVRLDTTAEKKDGGDKDILRITVLDQGTDRDYRTYSGAERFMVDMGLRVALARFLAHRAGAEINLFVIDEGLGALTPANREAIVAALEEVSREFGVVLVITHIPEVYDRLPQRITVLRGDDTKGSTVQVVA